MRLAVLIPYRPDNPHRADIQRFTSGLWAQTGLEVHYPNDGRTGIFSYAQAANRGRHMTDADAVLMFGVDHIPPTPDVWTALLERLEAGCPWTFLYTGQHRYTEDQTDALLHRGATLEQVGPPAGTKGYGMSWAVAVRTDVYDHLRGYDERFIGWGPEDGAFHAVLNAYRPDGNPKPVAGRRGPALWHPVVTTYAQTRAAGLELWNTHYRPWLNHPDQLLRKYLQRPDNAPQSTLSDEQG